jgi:hypothetical protein
LADTGPGIQRDIQGSWLRPEFEILEWSDHAVKVIFGDLGPKSDFLY